MRIFLCLPILFYLASMVAGKRHYSCTCHNGQSYHWRITSLACDKYSWSHFKWGTVHYDKILGRCISDEDDMKALGGNEWEAICKDIAKGGYPCPNNFGRCLAPAKEVKGMCD